MACRRPWGVKAPGSSHPCQPPIGSRACGAGEWGAAPGSPCPAASAGPVFGPLRRPLLRTLRALLAASLAPGLLAGVALAPFSAWAPGSAWAAARDRYDRALLVCRSIDPTHTLLNLREQPQGRILGTLSRQSVVYVRGHDWRYPLRGYVPVRFYREARPAVNGKEGAGTAATPPAGWVWQAYLTCELAS